MLIALSVASPFIGLPGGRTLLDELIHANPLAVAAALLALLAVLLAPLGRWSTAWRDSADATALAWPDDPAIAIEG